MIDVRGVEIKVGHVVAFADRDGNVARMRSGKVLAVVEAEQKVTIQWDDESAAFGPKKSTVAVSGVYVDRPRICVVNP